MTLILNSTSITLIVLFLRYKLILNIINYSLMELSLLWKSSLRARPMPLRFSSVGHVKDTYNTMDRTDRQS